MFTFRKSVVRQQLALAKVHSFCRLMASDTEDRIITRQQQVNCFHKLQEWKQKSSSLIFHHFHLHPLALMLRHRVWCGFVLCCVCEFSAHAEVQLHLCCWPHLWQNWFRFLPPPITRLGDGELPETSARVAAEFLALSLEAHWILAFFLIF